MVGKQTGNHEWVGEKAHVHRRKGDTPPKTRHGAVRTRCCPPKNPW